MSKSNDKNAKKKIEKKHFIKVLLYVECPLYHNGEKSDGTNHKPLR